MNGRPTRGKTQGHVPLPLAATSSLAETQTWQPDPGLVAEGITCPVKWTRMSFKRPPRSRSPLRLLVLIGMAAVGATGCGDGPSGPDFNPDFMVGSWLADSLVMTSVANPQVVADLVALGATFTLSVEASGRYTAILDGFGQSSSASGRLTVDGAYVVFMQELPLPEESMGLWERIDDSVILEGESEFDFNLDGTPQAATLRQVLLPN